MLCWCRASLIVVSLRLGETRWAASVGQLLLAHGSGWSMAAGWPSDSVRHAAEQARKFRHRCTPMHTDGTGHTAPAWLVRLGRAVVAVNEPAGLRPISVHRCASVAKSACLLLPCSGQVPGLPPRRGSRQRGAAVAAVNEDAGLRPIRVFCVHRLLHPCSNAFWLWRLACIRLPRRCSTVGTPCVAACLTRAIGRRDRVQDRQSATQFRLPWQSSARCCICRDHLPPAQNRMNHEGMAFRNTILRGLVTSW